MCLEVLTLYLIWNPLLVLAAEICLSELFFDSVLISQERSFYEGCSRIDFPSRKSRVYKTQCAFILLKEILGNHHTPEKLMLGKAKKFSPVLIVVKC